MATLKRNTLWNLAGSGVPLIAALFAIPYLLKVLGVEAFGVLTLIWALIGYFSLFDFGVGRALTYEVGRRMPATPVELAPYVRAGISITLVTGLLGALIVAILAMPLAIHWLSINPIWQQDAFLSFLIAAFGVIPTTISSGLRGALEGLNRFALSNINRLVAGTLMFIIPALSVYLHGAHLWIATLYMVVARLVIMMATIAQLKHYLFQPIKLTKQHLSPLLNYGVWIAVTGIVGPLMVYGDRFFVSAIVGAALLPQYAIPQEGLQRLLIVPAALCGALLPQLAAHNKKQTLQVYNITFKRVVVWMLAICSLAAIFAYPVLSIWISPDFAASALPITLILVVGIWLNAISFVPFTVLHAIGKPKVTAIFHVIELMFYCLAIWVLAKHFGLMGAAIAWVLRVALDFVLLKTTVDRFLKNG